MKPKNKYFTYPWEDKIKLPLSYCFSRKGEEEEENSAFSKLLQIVKTSDR